MLISKRYRRKSELFESRFKDVSSVDFPVRQYLRCREDLFSTIVHVALLAVFAGTLMAFGRTLAGLFDQHGAHLSPWYERGAFALLAVFCLSVLCRLYYKVTELRNLRREMVELKATFRSGGSRGDDQDDSTDRPDGR